MECQSKPDSLDCVFPFASLKIRPRLTWLISYETAPEVLRTTRTMSTAPELRVLEDGEELAREAGDMFVWLGQHAIVAHGRFDVALSGGSTPKALYATLARPEFATQLDWHRVSVYFGDERCVPPDHPDSNFRMASELLLGPLNIPPERIFRMQGEDKDPARAARLYEDVIRKELDTPAPAWPRFDLILLGLGDDGHTASLFPRTQALQEMKRLVVVGKSSRGVKDRLTLTVPAINHAKAVWFLVSGSGKAGTARAVLEGRDQDENPPPAKLIRPTDGRLIWFMDQAAASELTISRQGIVSHEE